MFIILLIIMQSLNDKLTKNTSDKFDTYIIFMNVKYKITNISLKIHFYTIWL